MDQHFKMPLYLIVVASLFSIIIPTTPPYLHKLPLRFTSDYMYFADLYLGSNQQNITLLVDTGSRTLAAFCSLCVRGCEISEEFIIEDSQTFENVTCEAFDDISKKSTNSPSLKNCGNTCKRIKQNYQCKGQLNYGSSSLASYLDYLLIYDVIRTEKNGLTAASSFGCIYDENHFETGIWGVSVAPDNQFLDQIFKTDLAKDYKDAQRLFTICTEGAGSVMNIGGIDSSYHIGEGYTMRVNPALTTWWSITNDIGKIAYSNIVIREQNERFGTYNIILDSGTDFIILPASMVRIINQIVLARCESVSGCTKTISYQIFSDVYIINDAVAFFKGEIISFEIGGKVLETPLSNYFWNLGKGVWVLAVVTREEYNFEMSILGSIWMNNFDIVFNRQTFSITIYDITSCSAPKRRLQENEDDYDLPGVRQNGIDGVDAINKLKLKHLRGLKKMLNDQN